MQNKGFVKFIAVLLTLICLFYFSFSFVTNKYKKEAEKIEATQGKDAARAFLDAKRNEKVYLGWKRWPTAKSSKSVLVLTSKAV